jgi:hypothetical protein
MEVSKSLQRWSCVKRTLLGAGPHPVPNKENGAGEEAHAEFHENGGEQKNVDKESALQQREQSPLMVVVFVIGARPRLLEVPDQAGDFGVEAADVGWDGSPQPVGVAAVSNLKGTELRKEPGHDEGDGGRHDEAGRPAECRFSKRDQGSGNVARLCLAERLDCADISGEEGKHGDADTSLPWQTEEGKLEELGGGVFAVAGRPQAVVPRSAQMCDNDPERGYSTNTLQRSVSVCAVGSSRDGTGRTSTQVTFWRLFVDILGVVGGASEAGILRPESVARTMDSGIFTRSVMQKS